jgi:carbon monoxide dehydrogenase subunit G
MRIENTVEVDAPLDRVWALVNDIPRVAPCMPGAALTDVVDDRTYQGTVAVKLGPLRMSYKGKVVVEAVDEASHSARLAASGKDTKGAGTARANVETRLEAAGADRTRLQVISDVQLTGKVASFGRGGAINDVATRLFGQFADCLRATLESEPAPAAAAAPDTSPAEAAATAGTGGPAGSGGAAAQEGGVSAAVGDRAASGPAGATPATPTQPAPTGAAEGAGVSAGTGQPAPMTPGAAPGSPMPAQPPRAEALDAGSLVGTVIMGRLRALGRAIAAFFRRLFGRRPTGG